MDGTLRFLTATYLITKAKNKGKVIHFTENLVVTSSFISEISLHRYDLAPTMEELLGDRY